MVLMASVKLCLWVGLVCFAAAVLVLAWQTCTSSFCGRVVLVEQARIHYDHVPATDHPIAASSNRTSLTSDPVDTASLRVVQDGAEDLLPTTSHSEIPQLQSAPFTSASRVESNSRKQYSDQSSYSDLNGHLQDEGVGDPKTPSSADVLSTSSGSIIRLGQDQSASNIVQVEEEMKQIGENSGDGSVPELELSNGSMIEEQTAGQKYSCDGKRVYIYDLPAEFNSAVLEKCGFGMVEWLDFCPHIANRGFGKALPAPPDWYATDAYMLEVIYHHRMKNYSCLTSDPNAADAFFVPYYSGLDSLRFIYGADKAKRHEHGLQLIQWISENAAETWSRYGGSDHFLVLGRTAWDFSNRVDNINGWGTSFLELPEMTNVTALLLERRSWRDNEQAVPYPTSFHPSSPSRLREWISKVESSPRSFLFCFVGALRPHLSTSIRGSLFTQCGQHPSCLLLDCAQVGCSHNPQPISHGLLNSTFCLQPVGDSFTRRSTFDSIIAGCIPVFFHNESAYTQYMWHLPKNASLYSVFIPEEAIRGGALVKDVLESYSAEKIKEMQGHVKDLIERVVYFDFKDAADQGVARDAFDVAVDRMLGKAAQERASRQQAATGFQAENL